MICFQLKRKRLFFELAEFVDGEYENIQFFPKRRDF